MSCLELRDILVPGGGRCLVGNISLQIPGGTLFGLIGPNGAGKSSLLKAIAQLIPHRGHCQLNGQVLEQATAAWRSRQLGYLAQAGELAWPMVVRDFVSLGRLPHRRSGVKLRYWKPGKQQSCTDSASKNEEAISRALSQTALSELAERPLNQLSGGELARVRLARALAVNAGVLLVDEPCASLDPFHQLSVMELLRSQSRLGRVVVVVLHDLTLASRFCDQLLLLHEGAVIANGEPRHVLTPDNLQRVYQLQALHGEFHNQPYIVPWQSSCSSGLADSMNKTGDGLHDENSVR